MTGKKLRLCDAATHKDQVAPMLTKLGEDRYAGHAVDIFAKAGDGLSTPPYEHRMYRCGSFGDVLVERPDEDGAYWADANPARWTRL